MAEQKELTHDSWGLGNLRNEACAECSYTPTQHFGHGLFICKTCFDAWWCPKCTYRLSENHVCPTPEQIQADLEENRKAFAEIGINYDTGEDL